jgi:carnitine-CoA ligase
MTENDGLSSRYGILGEFYGETIHGVLARRATECATQPAVSFRDVQGTYVEFTYGELLRRSREFAAGLTAAPGSSEGDRVCVMLENHWQFVAAFFGCAMSGRLIVPVNTALKRAQLTHIISDASPSIFVVGTSLLNQLLEAVEAEDSVRCIVVVPDSSITLTGPNTRRGRQVIAYGEFAARSFSAAGRKAVVGRPETPMMIIYTSGTTGPSKGIVHCHRSALWFSSAAIYAIGILPSDVFHTCLPLFHANALLCTVLASIMAGSHSVVTRRFSLSGYWREVSECHASVTSMVGSMPALLWQAPRRVVERAHSLRVIYTAPMPENRLEFERRFSAPLVTTYGLTDASILTASRVDDAGRGSSCGRALDDWEIQVVDDRDEPVVVGQPGELVARPRLPYIGGLGYWRRAEDTVAAWRNLWHHTGDLVRQDEEDYFYFLDRKKDSIRKAGENISSLEVEDVIRGFARVLDAAVFAVPSGLGEDEVMALVIVDGEDSIDFQDIRTYCSERLPYFAVPRYWERTDELPRTETLRVRKAELRNRGVTCETWDAGPVRRG